MYVPPISNVTKDFFKDVFSGRKELLSIAEVKHINIPHYPELSVRDMYEAYKDDPKLKLYLPAKFAKGRQIDRSYFLNVLNTLYPAQVAKMIENARNQRYSAANEEVKNETIEITEEWREKLMSIPFKSRKSTFANFTKCPGESGRTIHLLKQKTKPHPGIRK